MFYVYTNDPYNGSLDEFDTIEKVREFISDNIDYHYHDDYTIIQGKKLDFTLKKPRTKVFVNL